MKPIWDHTMYEANNSKTNAQNQMEHCISLLGVVNGHNWACPDNWLLYCTHVKRYNNVRHDSFSLGLHPPMVQTGGNFVLET